MEKLLASGLKDQAQVSSAGTHAVVDSEIHPPMAKLLDQLGLGDPSFLARQLTKSLIGASDLILTATTKHRSQVVLLDPRAVNKTFTLLEYAIPLSTMDLTQLTGLSLADRLPVLTDHVQASRTGLQLPAEKLDIIDPYGFSLDVYEVALALIHQAVTTVTHALTCQSTPG
ncbi:MAG: hypothetical protein FWG08_06745 [Propionibacteriaceae bacterium]|nr:hypothetical protein [Propionibacteriaceae bacterium]